MDYILVLLGVLACAYLLLFLFSLIGRPQLLFPVPKPGYTDDDNIFKLTTASGLSISATYLENPDASHTLLYFHGNAEDLGSARENFTFLCRKAGFHLSLIHI